MDNTTTDNDNNSFRKILDRQHSTLKDISSVMGDMGLIQIEQLDVLKSIETIAKSDKWVQFAQVLEEKKIKDDEDLSLKESHEMNEHLKKIEEALAEQAHANNIKEMAEIIRTAILSEHALNAKTFKTFGERIGDVGKSLKDKFGSVSKTLDTLNIVKRNSGGFFSDILQKSDERKDYVKSQQMLGSTKTKSELKSDYKEYLKYSKSIQKNEEKLDKFRKLGLSDVEIEKTPLGKELLQKKTELTKQYSKYDIRASLVDDGMHEHQPKDEPKVKPEPTVEQNTTTFADNMSTVRDSLLGSKIKSPNDTQNTDHEAQTEQDKYNNKVIDILEKIEENTRPTNDVKPNKDKESSFSLDGIMKIIGDVISSIGIGLMGAIKTLVNSGGILKALGKGFVIADAVLSIGNGLIEGFKEWSESGDFKKAFRAGLGGVIEWLSMGLISKEDYKEYGVWFDKMVDDNIITPIKDFFTNMGTYLEEHVSNPLSNAFDNVSKFFHDSIENFMNIIKGIGIPEIDISAFSKWIPGAPDKIGPWYPFADDAQPQSSTMPEQVQPTVADTVYGKSTDNVEAKESATGGNSTVISAPTVNNNSKTIQSTSVKLPTRNPDTTSSRYISSRYAVA